MNKTIQLRSRRSSGIPHRGGQDGRGLLEFLNLLDVLSLKFDDVLPLLAVPHRDPVVGGFLVQQFRVSHLQTIHRLFQSLRQREEEEEEEG